MNSAILLLAAALLATSDAAPLALTAETPAAIPADSLCSARTAAWASPVYRRDGSGDDDAGIPGGNQLWSCRVGGRLLVVRDRAAPPGTYRCSATSSDETSAWIDGVKVVDRKEAGDIEDCYASSDNPRERLIVVQLSRKGDLMLCYRRVGGEDADAVRCVTTAARQLRGGGRDPNYRPPGFVTPPGFVLHMANAPVCAELTARLRPGGWSGDDTSLAAFAAPAAPGWGNAQITDGEMPPLSAVFDIDNDGAPDQVLLAPVMKVHGLAMGQLSWRPKASPAGKLFVAAEPLASAQTPPDQPSDDWMAFAWQPVRIEGRAYVYVRRQAAFDWDSGDEDFLAADPRGEKAITRSLIELKPDGTQKLVCAWGPRPRPELYL
ncbi:hypothetical protein QO010_003491 [Caulobacter ginsengisoli]|uniref:Uncharacterized protein n=1 Tax=Caulobacter ginsengisoli TaxID=400775 RepID=A0ABU0IUL3_9CAUL|nr:hypothetical protein [Caulobacter ginsengisoli]MDQ0465702.1 hypothetical protein [Caulobacter ginsengisoli]